MKLALVVTMLAGCGGGGSQVPRDRITDPGETLFNGYTKPDVKCFECHDGTGRGTKWGPALATRVPNLTDDQIAETIRSGKGKMPAFRGKLTDAEIHELVTWLRASFGPPASRQTTALPPGCKAQHTTFVSRCSGVPPEPGEPNGSETTVCDECLANSDCTAAPGGECRETGDGMCTGPQHLVCKYPDAACGNKICPEREVPPPP